MHFVTSLLRYFVTFRYYMKFHEEGTESHEGSNIRRGGA